MTLAIETLASAFGTHVHCIESWIQRLSITEQEIEFAMTNFNERERFDIFSQYIRPAQYLVENKELLKWVTGLSAETIKTLPESVFSAHLNQLIESDRLDDIKTNRTFPYNSYDAEVFTALRFAKKQSDIKFVKGMAYRKISHSSYPKARQKLKEMSEQLN